MKLFRHLLLTILLATLLNRPVAQPLSGANSLTYADTLRGSDGAGRNWWNVKQYDLHVQINIADSSISGSNKISYTASGAGNMMQIDLQEPMIIDSILGYMQVKIFDKTGKVKGLKKGLQHLHFEHKGNAHFVYFDDGKFTPGLKEITVYFHGKPRAAKNAPWDGGFIWKKDRYKNPWVSVACQGLGASVWYPCKDIQSDEPETAEMHFTIPDSLECISNGRAKGKTNNKDGTATWHWAVTAPINNYNIVPYIGKYTHFSEVYQGEAGKLDLDYWVLDSNLAKAKEHFKDVPRMLKAFEYWFGPFPFYKDGYKLVDAPHLGMEHQSAIAYGNAYKKGYMGNDLSGSSWGLKWDFIIVHESGHEWFANNITTKDIADMWVHEGFTNYSETLFTEYYYGKEAATAYISGIRKNIQNDIPIIGPYGVNKEGSGDMYYKAANMIHTIRQVINNDVLFRKILRNLNKTFYHKTVTSKQVEDFISKQSKIEFGKVFDQYLRTIQIPTLEYKLDGYTLQYRYTDCIDGFRLPVKIKFKGERWIKPTANWQTLAMYPEGDNSFTVDPNFYINTKKVD